MADSASRKDQLPPTGSSPSPGGPEHTRAPGEASSWNALDSTLAPPVPPAPPLAPSPADIPQQIGRFRLVRLLGRGGMGAVYEAVDSERGIQVALKTIRRDVGAGISRFLAEFHTLANLRHPNLVRIFEMGIAAGEPFFTMELLDGVTFRQWVGAPSSDGLSQDQVDRLKAALRQLADGLNHLHQSGHLHRDLKPSNVLVLGDGTVKILDLGLAVPLDSIGQYEASVPGMLMGTLPYMSPEQAAGGNLTPAADWYSVGVMLYECLTGRLPFSAPTMHELQSLKLRGCTWPVPWQGPTDLMGLALRLLAAQPQQRPGGDEVLWFCRGGERPPPSTHRHLVGRDELLSRLFDLFVETLRQGSTTLVLLEGPSGMGKSEILRWLADQLRRDGRADVYAARCYETVQLPYKAIDAINVGIARRLSHLSEPERRALIPLDADLLCEIWPVFTDVFSPRPVGRRLSAQERRRRAFAAYKELLTRMGPRGPEPSRCPPVLLIDDLQWADLDSVALLLELLRDPPPAMFMVWSYRQEDVSASPSLTSLLPEVETLAAAGVLRLEKSDLRPLSAPEAAQLVRHLLGSVEATATLVDQLVSQAAGTPLLLRELSEYVRQKCPAGQVCHSEHFPVRFTLDEVTRHWVENLTPAARLILHMIAAAGRPVKKHLLMRVVDCGESLWRDATDTLLGRRLIRVVGGSEGATFDISHDRTRETVLSAMPSDLRRQTHQRLAEALLAEAVPDVEFIGVQFLLAGCLERAGPFLVQAAQMAAESLAFDRAARLFSTALQCPLEGDAQLTAQVGYAQALANLGRCREAAEQFLQAAQRAAPDEAWNYRCLAACHYLTSGHTPQGLQVLDGVLASVGLRRPRSVWAALGQIAYWRLRLALPRWSRPCPANTATLRRLDVCWSAVSGLSLVDPLPAAAMTHRLLALAEQVGEPRRLLRAFAVFTSHEAIGGTQRAARSAHLLAEMTRLVRQHGGTYAEAILALTTGIVAHLQGRWRDTWTHCDHAVELLSVAEYPDVTWELDTAQTFALWARLYAGRMEELLIQQPLARRGAIERDDLFGRWNFGARVLAMVGLVTDSVADVVAALDEDARLLPQNRFHVQHHNLLLARTLVDLYEGRAAEAWQRMKTAWRHYRFSLLTRVQQVRIDFWKMYGLAALAAAIASTQSAPVREVRPSRKVPDGYAHDIVREVHRSVRRLRSERAAWATALAELLEAGLASLTSPHDKVASRFAQAMAALERVDMQLFAQAAMWRHWQWQSVGARESSPPQTPPFGISLPCWEKWLRWLAPSVDPRTAWQNQSK